MHSWNVADKGQRTDMKLRAKQSMFCLMVAKLIQFADQNGYALTFGDVFRSDTCTHGHPKSLHRLRLAVDFNAFKHGRYLTETHDYLILGEYWESIGGSWGGRFEDGNHFSLAHNGMR